MFGKQGTASIEKMRTSATLMSDATIEMLLIEDDAGTAVLTREALKESDWEVNLSISSCGSSALEYLREGPQRPRPDLILLDLNMPGMDGRDVLKELKGDHALRSIPVVVFTSSDAREDVERAYGLGCNCYVRKPMSLEQFSDAVRSIESFWFTVATLPA
jgi:CheY-like chemotaxis protein